MNKILLIGSGAREHAIARSVAKSKHDATLFCFSNAVNPGIKALCAEYQTGDVCDFESQWQFVSEKAIDFVIVGPEAPLEKGVADCFCEKGIPVIGPRQALAQIESSKGFTRDLLAEFSIEGSPDYQVFTSMDGVQTFFDKWPEQYVIKADGLMGGKGVKVFGDHLQDDAESLVFCESLIAKGLSFVLEEKLVGQEFSLISFSDGEHLAHCPLVQDHKRAFVGDLGPNTGGMGSYTDTDHGLPFISDEDIATAKRINQQTIEALHKKYGEKYVGFLYGGFIATNSGTKLIEYNARLGDPEAMNILSLLESDFIELCSAMIEGNLTQAHAQFAKKATVCKYAVPEGYPDAPVKGKAIDVSGVVDQEQCYLAAVDETDQGLIETGSRTAAIVGIGDTIAEAEAIAEKEVNRIVGPLFHRADIGTAELIEKRIAHMAKVHEAVQ